MSSEMTGADNLDAAVERDLILAMCRAHDREDAAQKGEPSPWTEEAEADAEWVSDRFYAMREAFDEVSAALSASNARAVTPCDECKGTGNKHCRPIAAGDKNKHDLCPKCEGTGRVVDHTNWKAEWEAVCAERIKDREAAQAIINERDKWIVELIRERDASNARAEAAEEALRDAKTVLEKIARVHGVPDLDSAHDAKEWAHCVAVVALGDIHRARTTLASMKGA